MAEHKIDGNDGAGNAIAMARDNARDAALVEAASMAFTIDADTFKKRYQAQFNRKRYDVDGVLRCQNRALNIQAEDARDAILALRDKPAPAVLPLLPDMVDAATAAGVVVWWDNEAQEIKMAVTVQEAARVLLGVFEDPDANAPHGFDWQSMYDEMTADHKESLDICGTHDWPSTLIVALRAIAASEA